MSIAADTVVSLTGPGFIFFALVGSLLGVGGALAACFQVLNWISRGRKLEPAASAQPGK